MTWWNKILMKNDMGHRKKAIKSDMWRSINYLDPCRALTLKCLSHCPLQWQTQFSYNRYRGREMKLSGLQCLRRNPSQTTTTRSAICMARNQMNCTANQPCSTRAVKCCHPTWGLLSCWSLHCMLGEYMLYYIHVCSATGQFKVISYIVFFI